MIEIKYKKISEKAKEPYRKYNVDAGFDLSAAWKKETDKYIEYGVDLAFEIPDGYVGLLFPRSSITKKDLMMKNSVGVIDASYRGPIVFRFTKNYNEISKEHTHRDNDFIDFSRQLVRKPDQYDVGEKIGQIVFIEIPNINLIEVNELSDTERGENGFGSTGN